MVNAIELMIKSMIITIANGQLGIQQLYKFLKSLMVLIAPNNAHIILFEKTAKAKMWGRQKRYPNCGG